MACCARTGRDLGSQWRSTRPRDQESLAQDSQQLGGASSGGESAKPPCQLLEARCLPVARGWSKGQGGPMTSFPGWGYISGSGRARLCCCYCSVGAPCREAGGWTYRRTHTDPAIPIPALAPAVARPAPPVQPPRAQVPAVLGVPGSPCAPRRSWRSCCAPGKVSGVWGRESRAPPSLWPCLPCVQAPRSARAPRSLPCARRVSAPRTAPRLPPDPPSGLGPEPAAPAPRAGLPAPRGRPPGAPAPNLGRASGLPPAPRPARPRSPGEMGGRRGLCLSPSSILPLSVFLPLTSSSQRHLTLLLLHPFSLARSLQLSLPSPPAPSPSAPSLVFTLAFSSHTRFRAAFPKGRKG